MTPNLFDTLQALLAQDPRFVAEDGTLLRNAVYEAAMGMDAGLLRLLLSDPDTRARFFTEADGILVFDASAGPSATGRSCRTPIPAFRTRSAWRTAADSCSPPPAA